MLKITFLILLCSASTLPKQLYGLLCSTSSSLKKILCGRFSVSFKAILVHHQLTQEGKGVLYSYSTYSGLLQTLTKKMDQWRQAYFEDLNLTDMSSLEDIESGDGGSEVIEISQQLIGEAPQGFTALLRSGPELQTKVMFPLCKQVTVFQL